MKKFLILLFVLFFTLPVCASINAYTDALQITENQPFNLVLTGGSLSQEPDLSTLDSDFVILSKNAFHSTRAVNGQVRSEQKITLTLKPKKTGLLTIPSLSWDNEQTNPIQIKVSQATSSVQEKDQTALFIEASVLNNQTYEGAGITYRVQVYERVGIVDGEFTAPQLENAQIIPLGKPSLSREEKDNILYRVLTQNYVIFPEKTGEVTIYPASFQGYYQQQKSEKLQPFGLMDSFIYQPINQKEVIVRAKPIKINVLPRPEEALKQWWLPSSKVELFEKWEGLDNAKVGQPITRRIELKALDVLGNMLPDIEIYDEEGFKVYSENPDKTQTYEENLGLIARENRSFAFIPLKSGRMTLPAISVAWFDLNEKVMKKATLPALQVDVADNPQFQPIIQSTETKNTEQVSNEKQQDKQLHSNFVQENNFLYFVSGLSIGLLIGLLGIIIVAHRKTQKSSLPELYPENK